MRAVSLTPIFQLPGVSARGRQGPGIQGTLGSPHPHVCPVPLIGIRLWAPEAVEDVDGASHVPIQPALTARPLGAIYMTPTSRALLARAGWINVINGETSQEGFICDVELELSWIPRVMKTPVELTALILALNALEVLKDYASIASQPDYGLREFMEHITDLTALTATILSEEPFLCPRVLKGLNTAPDVLICGVSCPEGLNVYDHGIAIIIRHGDVTLVNVYAHVIARGRYVYLLYERYIDKLPVYGYLAHSEFPTGISLQEVGLIITTLEQNSGVLSSSNGYPEPVSLKLELVLRKPNKELLGLRWLIRVSLATLDFLTPGSEDLGRYTVSTAIVIRMIIVSGLKFRITGMMELLNAPRAHLKGLTDTEINHVPEVGEELEYLRRGFIPEHHRPHDLNGHPDFSIREPLFKPYRPRFSTACTLIILALRAFRTSSTLLLLTTQVRILTIRVLSEGKIYNPESQLHNKVGP